MKCRPAAKTPPQRSELERKRFELKAGVLSLVAHLCQPCSAGRRLEGWQSRLGRLVLQAGRASLVPGALWTTGCMGQLLPHEMDLTAARLGHQRAAVQ